jgi:excisionase family DNA binding protein
LKTVQGKHVDQEDLRSLAATVDRMSPGPLSEAMAGVVRSLTEGGDVLVGPVGVDLSPADVAALLGVSRPHVYALIERGALPAHRVGTHWRLNVQDVHAYARQRDEGRRWLAESFAKATTHRAQVERELAGVDDETARRLGF